MNTPGTTPSNGLFKNSNIFMYLMCLFDHQSSVALYFVRWWPELPAGLCWGAQTHCPIRVPSAGQIWFLICMHQSLISRFIRYSDGTPRSSTYLPGAMFVTRQISYIVYVCIHSCNSATKFLLYMYTLF